jgi:hypothetical protein
MELDTKSTDEKILEQLILLNEKTRKHDTTRHIFYTGIIYGFGFFLGSAILATIVLGALSPWFGRIDWIKENFERGESLKQASVQAFQAQ